METIKKTKNFKIVYSKGRQAVNAYFVLYAMPNNKGATHIGITVSKKVGNAVTRNKIRRLVKESFRLMGARVVSGYDIVIVARRAVSALPKEGRFRKVDKSLTSLLTRLNLVNTGEN